MLWLVLVCACACVRAAEFGCRAPRCELNNISSGCGSFVVEGHTILFGYNVDVWDKIRFDGLYIDCGGWAALESAALPRFNTTRAVSAVLLKNCPLPAGAPLVAKLAPLNVVLEPKDNEFKLYLQDLPAEPRLTADHFSGLESLTTLAVFTPPMQKPWTLERGLLSSLSSLRALLLSGFEMNTEELRSLRSLVWLRLATPTKLELHQAIADTAQAVPSLRVLKLDMTSEPETYDNMRSLDQEIGLHEKYFGSETHGLAALELSTWTEKKPSPLQYCENLRAIEIKNFNVEELPSRWVAECPLLERIAIWQATRLTSLPDDFLEGATKLRGFRLLETELTSLPDGFLKDAHKLEYFDVSSAKIKTLNSDLFLSARATLDDIEMSDQELDNSALAAFSGLRALTSLDLSKNKLHGDVCDEQEFSAIRELPKLETLRLSGNQVVRCPHWKSHFRRLWLLQV